MNRHMKIIYYLFLTVTGFVLLTGCGNGSQSTTLTAITVLPADPIISSGSNQQFVAVGTYSDGTQRDLTDSVTWASDPRSSALITTNGLAVAALTGTARITATFETTTGGSTLTVTSGSTAQPGDTWAAQTIDNTIGLGFIGWSGTNYLILGFGSSGMVYYTSPDGLTWTQHPSYDLGWATTPFKVTNDHSIVFAQTSSGLRGPNDGGIVWTGTQYVGVWVEGGCYTSTDGVTWTRHETATHYNLISIAWSGTGYVAVGDQGTIVTSSDAVTWARRASGVTDRLHYVMWSGTQFVATGDNGTILTSPDGITWTRRNARTTAALYVVASSGSKLVAVGNGGTILTSRDGVIWTQQTSGTASDLYGVAYSGTRFVAVGKDGVVLASPPPDRYTQQ